MSLAQSRGRYARAIAAEPGVDDPRVVEAFANVPRERFVGPGPWQFLGPSGYVESASSDPALLYADVVVALAPDRRINNGQPTLHARCLSAVRARPGERVLHIGCGSGYYSAILSELVARSGRVDAWDLQDDLVRAATRNLEAWPNVNVERRDGTASSVPASDVIYVCAGCSAPVRAWAEALTQGGRLMFPLTPGWDYGVMLMVTRRGEAFEARSVCRCSFIPCVGGSDEANNARLEGALAAGTIPDVDALHFGDIPDEGAWLAGDGWWLSTRQGTKQ